MSQIFNQGDIIWIDCSPQVGHEQSGKRPAIVVSNFDFNRTRCFAVVCPITTKDRDNPMHVRLDDRTNTMGVILTDQVRSLDMDRRGAVYIERAPDDITMDVLDIIAGIIEAQ